MTSPEPHVHRAVKVTAVRLGSGYAVGPDLVLTSGHVVGGRGEPAHVSRSDSPSAPDHRATVIWRGDDVNADAALLRLDVPLWTVTETRTRYGALRGHQPVECLTVGYPLVAFGRDGLRRLDELPGFVMPNLGFEDNRYALDTSRIAPKEPEPDLNHPHSGYSGAPLLTNDDRQLLLGVMVAVPSGYAPGRIDAVRITQLLRDPVFAGLVGASADEVELVPRQVLPTGILDHDEALAELADNLRGGLLPYVAPADTDADAHPARLLARLDECAGEHGLLLVGQAGIGKTRTCVEVANHAVAEGWRVLHVRPGEPLVNTDHLLDVVNSRADERLLIIVDYLNLSGLDYPAIRYRLLPAARKRGIRLALLGSARPGWFHHRDNSTITQAFKPVDLEPAEEHLDRIRAQIIETLAPTARKILGDERLAYLCGRRPIIATLVAAEAEAQAERGRLTAGTADVRPEYLLDWLVRRLNEDDLLHQAERLDDDRKPDVRLRIYAAMAAATPQPRPALIACGARVRESDESRAEHLLDVLTVMGWMTRTSDGVAPVHDIVVDQLLEHTMVRAALHTVRADVADDILDAGLTSARTVGRFAMNLSRVLRDLALHERHGPLTEHCRAWLARNATEAGTLLSGEQDAGAYALGAVLDNPPWAQTLFADWPRIGAPWLTRHGTSLSARHILYKGLRSVAANEATHLIDIASGWLDLHATAPEATFVTSRLLARPDLTERTAHQAAEAALAWLHKHGPVPDAGFVLSPLLNRSDLTERTAVQSVDAALAWLDRVGPVPDAGFVLDPLLGRSDLTEQAARRAVDTALAWLDEHALLPDAKFVLAPLLGRSDLTEQAARKAVDAALRWLSKHGWVQDAFFVLGRLLGRPDLAEPDVGQGADAALAWLAQHGTIPDARFVLDSLLGRTDLTAPTARRSVDAAFAWLDQAGPHASAEFVLHALLGRPDLTDQDTGRAVDAALAWLQEEDATIAAGYVLPRLLGVRKLKDLPEWVSPLIDRWADRHRSTADVVFVTKHLSRQNALTEVTADVVLQWAEDNPRDVDIPWRLTGVASGMRWYPALAGRLLARVEDYVYGLDGQTAKVNDHGELDSLVQIMCRSSSLRCGLAGARLDDVVLAWLAHPCALSPNCPPDMDFEEAVKRVCSLVRAGRYAPGQAVDVLTRLLAWMARWRPADWRLESRTAELNLTTLLAELRGGSVA